MSSNLYNSIFIFKIICQKSFICFTKLISFLFIYWNLLISFYLDQLTNILNILYFYFVYICNNNFKYFCNLSIKLSFLSLLKHFINSHFLSFMKSNFLAYLFSIFKSKSSVKVSPGRRTPNWLDMSSGVEPYSPFLDSCRLMRLLNPQLEFFHFRSAT